MFALNTNVNCLYIQTYEYAKVRADKMTIYIYTNARWSTNVCVYTLL